MSQTCNCQKSSPSREGLRSAFWGAALTVLALYLPLYLWGGVSAVLTGVAVSFFSVVAVVALDLRQA